jgi:hypothetical protein
MGRGRPAAAPTRARLQQALLRGLTRHQAVARSVMLGAAASVIVPEPVPRPRCVLQNARRRGCQLGAWAGLLSVPRTCRGSAREGRCEKLARAASTGVGESDRRMRGRIEHGRSGDGQDRGGIGQVIKGREVRAGTSRRGQDEGGQEQEQRVRHNRQAR